MEKPTAQELWEIIPLRILACVQASIQTHNCSNEVEALKESIQLYAQAYHEEQMRDFVGIPQGKFTCAFLDKINVGLIKLKTYPTNPQSND